MRLARIRRAAGRGRNRERAERARIRRRHCTAPLAGRPARRVEADDAKEEVRALVWQRRQSGEVANLMTTGQMQRSAGVKHG
ncbi:hypothetical protein BZM26_30865 [Paraburkholderia strydomiana]|nr:hypothetical protein BZM26_30865 [Paraburkholderia strydomiana]